MSTAVVRRTPCQLAAAGAVSLVGGGVLCLVRSVCELVADHGSSADFVPVRPAENWLHLGLAAAMIALGVVPMSARRSL
ncbi:DUF4383 domain-containing protein [Amycolatopsis orientalis]|uniref:DUF4383 domain-containing protein n=1 Tax=Amycolatopsis orientalis TaxID=31958 RepID=UPI0009DBBE4A|nr:DUF4383 domain-containing protein [Amycolatopsis orientalis]